MAARGYTTVTDCIRIDGDDAVFTLDQHGLLGSDCNRQPLRWSGWRSARRWYPTVSSEGQYVIGNQVDPTAITLSDLNATTAATPWPLVLAAAIVVAAMLALGLVLRRRTVKA